MAGKKHKQPTFNQSLVRDGKQPRATAANDEARSPRQGVDDPSALEQRPSWQFSAMDMAGHGKDGQWACSVCTEEQVHAIRERLVSYEKLSWREIMFSTKSHSIPVSTICPGAYKRLKELNLDHHDHIFSFRITQAQRLWGIRQGAVFLILWWDPEHSVYPMNIADN